ncbi:DUF2065 domain-containing protein [Marinomonas sp. 15G1-11]|uniref:DUF2065 domain-containing protein n=1 Tax=Marinomonas phaeophyticola TaxID=3004091 RepID=A0ABT4JXG1_9GAMM|nr:DUF2065 domain-containing protein [Marinomonas sp. 15G1-11]MCZ2723083.1 DUF2065 domain-containing protein [Marinomonas sp. 15G1-11]
MHELLLSLLVGVSLLLIVEGFLPFLAPDAWRKLMLKVVSTSDANVRIIGAVSMFLGLLLLYIVRS